MYNGKKAYALETFKSLNLPVIDLSVVSAKVVVTTAKSFKQFEVISMIGLKKYAVLKKYLRKSMLQQIAISIHN